MAGIGTAEFFNDIVDLIADLVGLFGIAQGDNQRDHETVYGMNHLAGDTEHFSGCVWPTHRYDDGPGVVLVVPRYRVSLYGLGNTKFHDKCFYILTKYL